MTKTGESYTTARSQLIRKAGSTAAIEDGHLLAPGTRAAEVSPIKREPRRPTSGASGGRGAGSGESEAATGSFDPAAMPTSDASMQRATGRSYGEWFVLLDRWGARDRTHTDTAAWLVADQAVTGWWAQSITVGYERARGRALHQVAGGYSVGANRTIAVAPTRLLAAVTDAAIRARWLPGAELTRRRRASATAAALTVRFDWADPPSRLAVFVVAKGPDKATISIQHEKLPDAEAANRLKAYWRERLAELKSVLERESA
jgi:uncharacterized protein YndB with AHSA1/START domain